MASRQLDMFYARCFFFPSYFFGGRSVDRHQILMRVRRLAECIKLGQKFGGSELLRKASSKLIENCGCRRVDRQTDRQARVIL